MIRRSTASLLAVTLLLLVPELCHAAAIEAIPDNALVVFRFRRPAGTVKKAISVAAKIDKEYETSLNDKTKLIGAFIGNPQIEGVDPNGDWWLAILEGSSGQSAMVWGIPFKDKEDKLKGATQGGFTFVKHEKFLFYSTDQGATGEISERVKGTGKSISSVIGTSLSLFNRSDIGIFVNVKKIAQKSDSTFSIVSEELDSALKNWKTLAPSVEGMDLAPLYQMYGDAAKTVLQGIRDCEGYTAAVELSLKGAKIEQQLRLKPSSATDQLLQSQKSSDLKELEKLPADQLVYTAVHGDFSELTQWSYKFAAELFKDEATRTELRAVADEQAKLKYSGYLMSFNLGDVAEGAYRTTMVMLAEPVDKLREVTRKSAALLPALNAGGVNQKVDIKPDAEKIGNFSADLMNIRTELDKSKLSPEAIAALEKSTTAMYGPEGMTQRIVYLGDRAVITSGGGKSTMEAAITAQQRSRSGSEANSPFNVARKELPEKANFVFLVDIPRLIVGFAKVMDEMPKGNDAAAIQPIGNMLVPFKDLEVMPSYFGMSVTIGPATISSTTYIPIEQAEGLNEIWRVVKEALGPFLPAPLQ